MNDYRTLNGEVFCLNELTSKERALYDELMSLYDADAEWRSFSDAWSRKIKGVLAGKEGLYIVEEPIYKICQDLESRLGIRQGYTREPDYRDLLADIISRHFKSRYQFCKEMGIDQGYLSAVLARKKHLSMKKLEEILSNTGHRIAFVEKVGAAR